MKRIKEDNIINIFRYILLNLLIFFAWNVGIVNIFWINSIEKFV